MIVSCHQLDQSYGGLAALSGVSFEVSAPCTGLLGPNGAGKSTLFKCLLGQRPLQPGQLQVAGFDPALQPLLVRQRVGYMPERDVYLQGMNALEMVTFCGQLSGMKRSDAVTRAHEVLNYVSLGEARYREVEGYSTGMRQRVRLAQALVHGPELLLLDEPTTGLDPAGREEMLQLVDDVSHRAQVNVIFSSHILKDIDQICDHLLVLNEGRLLYCGPRDAFVRQESRRYHVRVKRDPERLAQALSEARCQVSQQAGEAFLTVELPSDQPLALVWQVARQSGIQVRHLAPAGASLEQAFAQAVVDRQEAQLEQQS